MKIQYHSMDEMRAHQGLIFTVNNRWRVEYDRFSHDDKPWGVWGFQKQRWTQFRSRGEAMAFIAASEVREFEKEYGFAPPPPARQVAVKGAQSSSSDGFGWGVAAGLILGGW